MIPLLLTLLVAQPQEGVVAARAAALRVPAPAARAARIEMAARLAAERFHVPLPIVLGVIEVESAYQPSVESSMHCIGLMQLNLPTAVWISRRAGVWRFDLLNVGDNIHLGVAYLAYLYSVFGRWDFVLTSYNQGPGLFERRGHRVSRYAKQVLAKAVEMGFVLSVDKESPKP